MHAGLGNDLVAPALKSFGGAVGIACGLPLSAQAGFKVGQGADACAQVVFKPYEAALKVGQKLGGVNHCVVFPGILELSLLFW